MIMADDSSLLCKSSLINLKWSIKKFLNLPLSSNYYLESPTFSLCDGKWSLKIYPNRFKNTVPYISLFVAKKKGITDQRIAAKVTLKKADGSELKVVKFERKFTREMPAWGWLYLMERSALLRSEEGVAPDNSLEVFCTLRLVKAVQLISQKPRIDGMETLSQNLKDLYTKSAFTDVTIAVGNKEFPAHRSILSARSTVFASMFKHDMVEKITGKVTIDDCNPDSFEKYLLFLYTGRLGDVSADQAISLYKAGDKYDLKDLKSLCLRRLAITLSADSFCDVIYLATMHYEVELLNVAEKFFLDNAISILSTAKWKNFIVEHPMLGSELFRKFVNRHEE